MTLDVYGVWVDGEPADRISALDRGLQFGDGLFETIAVAEGAPLLLERHIERLKRGCGVLALDLDEALLRRTLQVVCDTLDKAVVKVILTRGAAGRGYACLEDASPTLIVSAHPRPHYPQAHWRRGVVIGLCETRLAAQPALAGIKHLNRLEQVLARREWKSGWSEGLVMDEEGGFIEGTMSNLFVVDSKGVVLTPDLRRCGIAGVIREEILQHQERHGLPCRETPIGRGEVLAAREIFLTNSVIGLWPVRRLADRRFPVGACARHLQDYLRENKLALIG